MKEVQPIHLTKSVWKYSVEGLLLQLQIQRRDFSMQRLTQILEKSWCWKNWRRGKKIDRRSQRWLDWKIWIMDSLKLTPGIGRWWTETILCYDPLGSQKSGHNWRLKTELVWRLKESMGGPKIILIRKILLKEARSPSTLLAEIYGRSVLYYQWTTSWCCRKIE